MIDLHCHILPGMDDGAADTEESLGMASLAAEQGVAAICATPHLLPGEQMRPQTFFSVRDERLQQLQAALQRREIAVTLHPGAEVYVNDDIFYAGDLRPAALGGSRFLLVEFGTGMLPAARLRQYLEEIRNRGLTPVIAHAERYRFFQRNEDLLYEISEEGTLIQVNADSVAGYAETAECRLAYRLVREGVAHLLATDAHGIRHRIPAMATLIRRFPPGISTDTIRYLTETAPQAMLKNKWPPPRIF
ncbi:MAG: hypothetical protein LBS96_04705 [Oscillospiraceae bacterium]|jgi:protein-tyrosine phosphatase|nr:hypothetical protein [Oscillospiraceae bacterium]